MTWSVCFNIIIGSRQNFKQITWILSRLHWVKWNCGLYDIYGYSLCQWFLSISAPGTPSENDNPVWKMEMEITTQKCPLFSHSHPLLNSTTGSPALLNDGFAANRLSHYWVCSWPCCIYWWHQQALCCATLGSQYILVYGAYSQKTVHRIAASVV